MTIKTLLFVLALSICAVFELQAQTGLNITSAETDTVRTNPYGLPAWGSYMYINQNVQAFNDTVAKYGYGRFSSGAGGVSLGYEGSYDANFRVFASAFLILGFGGGSEKYSLSLLNGGISSTLAYVILRNEVFRFYPLGGVSWNIQMLNIQERKSATPSMLNAQQFPTPWRLTLWNLFDINYFIGIGADVRLPNLYNRYFRNEHGMFQLDAVLGLRLQYNSGGISAILRRPQDPANYWSGDGVTIPYLPAITAQGLQMQFTFSFEMVKVK
ncbi:MAG: hypothetical protein EAZ92_14575 [Candidatus Kapaibacterium sp.]|nr:MAG: hypothetical protein EAZ92_14575 [Candidatus Kapabacteria bacterium]